MDFIATVVVLVLAIVLLTAWEVYDHRKRGPGSPPVTHTTHHWKLGSVEQTAGKTIHSYVCDFGHDRHVERREV